jgi:hypothetical protein
VKNTETKRACLRKKENGKDAFDAARRNTAFAERREQWKKRSIKPTANATHQSISRVYYAMLKTASITTERASAVPDAFP